LSPQGAIARTPLHPLHAAIGAQFADTDGWRLPAVYTSAERETAAAREGLALADLSAFARIGLIGPGVADLARALLGEGAGLRPRGVSALGDDVLACRLTDDHLLLLGSGPSPIPLQQRLANLGPVGDVVQIDATTVYAALALVGPRVWELLPQLTALPVGPADWPVGSCAETGLAGVPALLVRAPELAVPTVRVLVSWDLAEFVAERILAAGRAFGITPLGLDGWRGLAARK
jgi:glycine cleavage system aminomethyltransferase T